MSVISLEATLDTGPVHIEEKVPVGEKTARELTAELALLGASAMLDVLATPELLEHPRSQRGVATYAEKLSKETYHLTPSMTATLALRTVRLGGAFLNFEGRRIIIDSARASEGAVGEGEAKLLEGNVVLGTSDGSIVLGEVRPAGSSSMSAAAWWRGQRDGSERRWS